jgi:pimeloyl-ACP methyl ester carboxylesterase
MRDAPQLARGVILMHTKADADNPPARARRLEVARQVLHLGTVEVLRPMAKEMISATSRASQPGLVETIEHWIDQATPGGVAWAEEAMAGREDATTILRSSGIPATIITGTDDPFVSVARAEAMADALGPNATLTVLSDVAHLGPLETPHTVVLTIREAYRRMTA